MTSRQRPNSEVGNSLSDFNDSESSVMFKRMQFLDGFMQRYGLPIVILFAIGWAMWSCVVWIGPRLDRLLMNHDEFIMKTAESTETLGKAVTGINHTLDEMRVDHRATKELVIETKAKVDIIKEHLESKKASQ